MWTKEQEKEYNKEYSYSYYRQNREKRIQQMHEYGINHKNERKEYVNNVLKNDSKYLYESRIRKKSGKLIRIKNLKKENYEIHHAFGFDTHRSFIYLPKDLHKELHLTFGQKNEDCLVSISKVKQWINKHKDEIIIIIDGEIKKTLK